MRRRLLAVGLSFLLAASVATSPGSSFADTEDVSVWFNGEPVQFEVAPVIREDRTFVPVRFVLERIQAEIKWDEVKRQVLITYGPKNVTLSIDSRTVLVNGKPTEIDVAPFIYKDRTMVPLRFLAETFGFTVDWQASIRTVVLIPPSPLIGMIEVPSSPGSGESTGTAPESPGSTVTAPPSGGGTTVTQPTAPPATGGTTVTTPPAPTSGTPVPSQPTEPGSTVSSPEIRVVAPATVQVGQTFTVSVQLQSVSNVQSTLVHLHYDPAKVEAVTLNPGSIVEGIFVSRTIDSARSLVSYETAITGNRPFSGSGELFTVVFRAKATGQARFRLSPSIEGDPAAFNPSGDGISLRLTGATIEIQ